MEETSSVQIRVGTPIYFFKFDIIDLMKILLKSILKTIPYAFGYFVIWNIVLISCVTIRRDCIRPPLGGCEPTFCQTYGEIILFVTTAVVSIATIYTLFRIYKQF